MKKYLFKGVVSHRRVKSKKHGFDYPYRSIFQENIYDFYKKFSTKNNNLNINNVITIKDFNIDQLKSTREAIINSIFSDIMRSLRKIRNKNSNKDKELKEFLFKNNKPNLFSLRKYDNQKEFETLNFYINGIIDFRYLSFQLPLIYNHQNLEEIFKMVAIKFNDNFNLLNPSYGYYYLYNGFDVKSGLNRLTKCLIKINEYLYENEEDSNKKEYIELINKSSKTFDEYFQNCYKNNYETLYESKVININNLIKAIFNFDEKNYTNSKGEKIYIGIMPYNKQFGITLHSNYLNFLDKIYELYTKNYEFLNNIIKKSTKAIYHTKIAKLKERIEIRYNELSTKTFVNVQEVNIEVLHIFTEFKEVYENFLDEYKDNLKELLLIQNSISKNKNLFNNATQVRIISNEYNKFLSNALYFKYLAITYKKLVLLMFYDYRNKNPGLSAFTDIKLNTLIVQQKLI